MRKAKVHKGTQKTAKKTEPKSTKKPKSQPGGEQGKQLRQAMFLKVFPENNFHITDTCAIVGIGRSTYYDWMRDDPEFAIKLEDAREAKLDDWERQLHLSIMKGDITAIIFGLKTKGKDRGYAEREFASAKTIKIIGRIKSGELTVREAGYEFAILGLPLPEVIKIELAKQEPENPDPGKSLTPEELDRKYREALAKVDEEKKTFVPERKAEVAELKEKMKGVESFDVSQNKAGE